MELINGDCIVEMKKISDKSIDLIFCDLPYGQTACKWDCLIDLDLFWKEIMRIKKLHTPIIMTCTTKFGISLLNSCPKKCPFRYDLVWCKSSPCGFLCAKKMPMRKHEMIYVFYEKLPFYDLSMHKHKFKDNKEEEKHDWVIPQNTELYGKAPTENNVKLGGHQKRYEPPLPTSLIKENNNVNTAYGETTHYSYPAQKNNESIYEPPLPHSLLEIKSTYGKHSTEKPVDLMKWILNYYSKEDDTILDPTMGSGSMGVACKVMKRNFIGIEKDPEIFKKTEERINL